MKDIWDLIKSSFSVNPRNVLTYGGRKYFYVYTDGNNVHLESGHNCPNGSNISTPRTLDRENLNAVFEEYKNGSKPSDVTKITFNSVYWFGIFKDLKLQANVPDTNQDSTGDELINLILEHGIKNIEIE